MYSFISFNTTELIPAKWSTHVTAVDVGDTEIVLCLVGAHDLFFFSMFSETTYNTFIS